MCHKLLAKEILRFLKKHGKRTTTIPQEWGGPDPATLELFALWLLAGTKELEKPRVFSSWDSGHYEPLGGEQARVWHDMLLKKIGEVA